MGPKWYLEGTKCFWGDEIIILGNEVASWVNKITWCSEGNNILFEWNEGTKYWFKETK